MAKKKASSARYYVSKELFAILTEAIHLLSDREVKFHTLPSVVTLASENLYDHVFDAAHFQTFIDTVPMNGPKLLYLKVEACANERLTEMRARLEKAHGFPIPDRTAMAYFVQLGIENKLY